MIETIAGPEQRQAFFRCYKILASSAIQSVAELSFHKKSVEVTLERPGPMLDIAII
jgi:hypothetical protein